MQPLKCNAKCKPCSCTACKDLRKEGGGFRRPQCGDQKNMIRCDVDNRNNFFTFVTETLGVIAFFLIATIMFWLSAAYYLLQFIIKIYKSDRSTQVAALILASLLLLSIAINVIRKKSRTRQRMAQENADCHECTGRHGSGQIELKTENGEDLSCHQSNIDCSTVTKNITITITDSEAKEIFKQSKLFAIPTEMKQPPALLASGQSFSWIPFPFHTRHDPALENPRNSG